MSSARLQVLWVYHSGVVAGWRQGRMRALADEGVDVSLVSTVRWNEGGAVVDLDTVQGENVTPAKTAGTHPFLFGYDPKPIRRLLQRTKFDVIDAHEEPASLALAEILALVRATQPETPVVCYSAQNIFKTYPPPFQWLEQRALRRVSAVHSCNEQVEEVLRAKGFTGEVVNLGLGVDLAQFAPSANEVMVAPKSASLRVGYVGRIEDRKGVFTLLHAAVATPGVELTFVGEGPDRARLDTAIAARGISERVRTRGFVDHHELPALYRRFDVVVVPSLDTASWREQFGRVVVEAMAAGVPVITSDAGALAEVVGDGGLVTPQGDTPALVEALTALRDSVDLRTELRAKGLVRAAHFSWASIAKAQAALYDRVTHGAGMPNGVSA